MKKINFIPIIGLLALCFSCNKFLDVVPDNVPTLEHAFLDKTSAQKYLATCYTYLPNLGSPSGDPALMGSDEFWCIEDPFYNGIAGNYYGQKLKKSEQNSNEPLFNFWDGLYNGRAMYRAIRDCNVFLENIEKVGGDLTPEETKRWSAEVKFLKAYYHYYLLRMYGPIPLQKISLPVSTGIGEVRVYRDPFDECVDYCVSLLNEAIPDLPLQILFTGTELGRITQPAALALKAELLVTAASPLFNGNPDFTMLTDNRGTKLFKAEYDATKWQKAAVACKNAIDTALLAGHELYEFTKYTNISDSTKRVMSLRHVVADRWNKEIIWTEAKLNMRDYYLATTPLFSAEQFTGTDPWLCPTLTMVELFYTRNGVPIEEDASFDYADRYNTILAPVDHKFYIKPGFETAKINVNREPRFYANLAFDGGLWFGNGRFKDVGRGLATEQPWVIETKKGKVQGKNSSIRHSITGYYTKKTSHFESVATSSTNVIAVSSTFPIIRLADLYLLYTEALNESMNVPTAEVYQYIDLVRQRAGLKGVVESWQTSSKFPTKPTTKDGMREIVQTERMIELAFEGKRYWDIRRWKTAYIWLNQPARGLNDDGATALEFNAVRTFYTPEFATKDYLSPIRQNNLRVNPNIVQNPYWN